MQSFGKNPKDSLNGAFKENMKQFVIVQKHILLLEVTEFVNKDW